MEYLVTRRNIYVHGILRRETRKGQSKDGISRLKKNIMLTWNIGKHYQSKSCTKIKLWSKVVYVNVTVKKYSYVFKFFRHRVDGTQSH